LLHTLFVWACHLIEKEIFLGFGAKGALKTTPLKHSFYAGNLGHDDIECFCLNAN